MAIVMCDFLELLKNCPVGETLIVFIYLMENSVLVLHGASTCIYIQLTMRTFGKLLPYTNC